MKKAGAKIKAIAMDMWNVYISAALNHYSHEVIVFDHYHVISDYNKMLDELRRTEVAKASESEKKIYVGVRYLLSTGKVEGINNKIKVLKRQAYGYRDM